MRGALLHGFLPRSVAGHATAVRLRAALRCASLPTFAVLVAVSCVATDVLIAVSGRNSRSWWCAGRGAPAGCVASHGNVVGHPKSENFVSRNMGFRAVRCSRSVSATALRLLFTHSGRPGYMGITSFLTCAWIAEIVDEQLPTPRPPLAPPRTRTHTATTSDCKQLLYRERHTRLQAQILQVGGSLSMQVDGCGLRDAGRCLVHRLHDTNGLGLS